MDPEQLRREFRPQVWWLNVHPKQHQRDDHGLVHASGMAVGHPWLTVALNEVHVQFLVDDEIHAHDREFPHPCRQGWLVPGNCTCCTLLLLLLLLFFFLLRRPVSFFTSLAPTATSFLVFGRPSSSVVPVKMGDGDGDTIVQDPRESWSA